MEETARTYDAAQSWKNLAIRSLLQKKARDRLRYLEDDSFATPGWKDE